MTAPLPLQERLDALDGRIMGLLTICQALALDSKNRPLLAHNLRQLAELQHAKWLGAPVSEKVFAEHERLIVAFLDGLE